MLELRLEQVRLHLVGISIGVMWVPGRTRSRTPDARQPSGDAETASVGELYQARK